MNNAKTLKEAYNVSKFSTQNYSGNFKIINPMFNRRLIDIFQLVNFLSREYPNFKEWFFLKVIPDVNIGTRTIITKLDNKDNIVALSIIKHNLLEKKICTLWVKKNYRSMGLGSELMEDSMSLLQTDSPLITVSEIRFEEFNCIFKKYNFQLYKEYPSYYNVGISELSFNAGIEKKYSTAPDKGLTLVTPYIKGSDTNGTKLRGFTSCIINDIPLVWTGSGTNCCIIAPAH